MKGIIDRFADKELAVILIEDTGKELHFPVKNLPTGAAVGTILKLSEVDGDYQITGIDAEDTKKQATHSAELMDALRRKKQGSKFKRN
ncbi:DUF3006 domain-containing protein [Ornithinibacillus gellani]|uniref:DUF3006 domain-containing protein n=1 Tax=Ornithinibacillus gellani TaxID=2293253 RepID=UPI000F4A2F8B|nr:DUF3006 domain-containing protein [Ornithinibacillus gellani]TQS74957.1 DUF3006 domain-containing protein [Ornithinibacillus gellani]